MSFYFHQMIEGDVFSRVMNSCSSDGGIHALTVFILACFVGYYVVWKVTPALHAPLMSVTNAISSVIIIGAILSASGNIDTIVDYVSFCNISSNTVSKTLSFFAILLVSINIIGGFMVTHRMLKMFHKK